MKVKLRDNLRYFEADDSDFYISAGEEKELFEKSLKSYSIKHHLFNGGLQILEGEAIITIKHATILFKAKEMPFCFGIEFGNFFKKNLETRETFWIDKDELTNYHKGVFEKLTGETEEEFEEDLQDETEEEFEEDLQDETEETEEPTIEELEASKDDGKWSKTDLMDMTKKEQIKILEEMGLSSKEIKELRVEENRVSKILELQ